MTEGQFDQHFMEIFATAGATLSAQADGAALTLV
jgi:hypothetical protein